MGAKPVMQGLLALCLFFSVVVDQSVAQPSSLGSFVFRSVEQSAGKCLGVFTPLGGNVVQDFDCPLNTVISSDTFLSVLWDFKPLDSSSTYEFWSNAVDGDYNTGFKMALCSQPSGCGGCPATTPNPFLSRNDPWFNCSTGEPSSLFCLKRLRNLRAASFAG